MLGKQVSVLAQAIRRALDVNDDCVMQQTVKQRRRDQASALTIDATISASVPK
jgi:hypothetical protein